jgi:hypothetical protein
VCMGDISLALDALEKHACCVSPNLTFPCWHRGDLRWDDHGSVGIPLGHSPVSCFAVKGSIGYHGVNRHRSLVQQRTNLAGVTAAVRCYHGDHGVARRIERQKSLRQVRNSHT